MERIANEEAVGCIKLENGEVWTARAYEDDHIFDIGERVEVIEIRGATALVHD
jgi:membrane protein implicated in regulation of membrane protease activity